MTFLLAVLLGAAASQSAQAPPTQPAPAAATQPSPEAYLQFMLGRRFESDGDIEAAIKAYKKAADLDPTGAEIRAELAGLYARQDRAREAVEWANAALGIDPSNREAHRILGLVYAALSDQPAAGRALGLGLSRETFTTRALDHLERADSDRIVDSSLHYALGRMALRRRDYRKAIAALQRFRDEQPGVPESALMLADALVGDGRRSEARQVLEEALAEQPKFVRGRVRLAELYEQDRAWTKAAEAYGLAASQAVQSAELRRRQASALLRAGQPAAARDVLNGLLAVPEPNPGDLYLLFQAQRDLRDLDAAEVTARKIIAIEPAGVRGVFALSQVLDERRDYAAEVKVLESAVTRGGGGKLPPDQLGALLSQLGFAYQGLGRHDQAIAVFERLRSLTPADPSGTVYLVQACLVAGRTNEAVAQAEQGLETFPDESRLTELLAEGYRRQDRIDRGIALVENALSRNDVPSLYVSLSELYAADSRFDAAEEVLRRAREKYPDDTAIAFQLGSVFDQSGRDTDAERTFRELLSRDPQNAPALNYLGYLLAERGRSLDEAVALISRALERDPGNASYLDSLGWAYFKLGKLDLAERNLRQAASELTTNSVVQDHLGDVLYRLNRVDEAIAAWRRALEGDGASVERAAIEAKIRDARKQGDRR